MRIVPSSKHDLAACERLAEAADAEVCAHLGELLVWLQDGNWPVSRPVASRLAPLGVPLIDPLREILRGSDVLWKYWVVQSLLPLTDARVVESLREDLDRIALSPTREEVQEELPSAVLELRNV